MQFWVLGAFPRQSRYQFQWVGMSYVGMLEPKYKDSACACGLIDRVWLQVSSLMMSTWRVILWVIGVIHLLTKPP